MENNYLTNKSSHEKASKKALHKESLFKHMRNCSSETKRSFKKGLNNKLVQKKSPNIDKTDKNENQIEAASTDKCSKRGSNQFNYSNNSLSKMENKYRKERIKTESLNFEATKENVANVCTPVSQIDFYATSDPAMKHYTSLTSEVKVKSHYLTSSQEMHHSLSSLRQKGSNFKSTNLKNSTLLTKKSLSKGLKSHCVSPRKSFNPKSNFFYDPKPKSITSPVSRASSKDQPKLPVRLKTRRKTNPSNDRLFGLGLSSKKKMPKFAQKTCTPKSHYYAPRLFTQNSTGKKDAQIAKKDRLITVPKKFNGKTFTKKKIKKKAEVKPCPTVKPEEN
ncbi:unnamed protein product [Moneuplotes crassus]|uniref:Uncharacterized protein n=1 Tax=Euplotes crassus TaxID=5936 RepID=A0AAD2D962_EUPCR|nr:unnamed protein product [Moneuplotes crassus]